MWHLCSLLMCLCFRQCVPPVAVVFTHTLEFSHCVHCDTRRNEFANTVGATGCSTCATGLLSNSTHCLGTVQANVTTKTTVIQNNITCVGAYYQETPSVCKLCPAGQQPRGDRMGCRNCGAGSFARESTVCLPCGTATYQDEIGQSSCKVCNLTQNEYTSKLSSTNCTKCGVDEVSKGSFCAPCLENQVSVNGECVKCAPPLYKIGNSCQPCNGTMIPVLGRCIECSKLLLRNSQCKRCQRVP